jgi:hypothetical protein
MGYGMRQLFRYADDWYVGHRMLLAQVLVQVAIDRPCKGSYAGAAARFSDISIVYRNNDASDGICSDGHRAGYGKRALQRHLN